MNSFAPNSRFTARIIILLILAFTTWTNVLAQQRDTDGMTPLGLSPGAPAGSYPLSDFDHVNLFNGSLNVSMPLVKVGSRGSTSYPITLRIDQKWLVPNAVYTWEGVNIPWLYRVFSNGQTVLLKQGGGYYTEMEVQYLLQRGYSEVGSLLIPPP